MFCEPNNILTLVVIFRRIFHHPINDMLVFQLKQWYK